MIYYRKAQLHENWTTFLFIVILLEYMSYYELWSSGDINDTLSDVTGDLETMELIWKGEQWLIEY